MTRRVDRRREAIQQQLLAGPMLLTGLARSLGRWRLTVWDDLAALMETGDVVCEWIPRETWLPGTGVWAYRLPRLDEAEAREAEEAAAVLRMRKAWQAALERAERGGGAA